MASAAMASAAMASAAMASALNGNAQRVGVVGDRVGVSALPGHEQRTQRRQIVLTRQRRRWIFLAHGSERGGGGEHGRDPMSLDESPVIGSVGRANGLSFVEHRRAAAEQRGVDDVGMAHHPAQI